MMEEEMMLPLPRLLVAMVLDLYRWYIIVGNWYRAIMTFCIGLLRAVAIHWAVLTYG